MDGRQDLAAGTAWKNRAVRRLVAGVAIALAAVSTEAPARGADAQPEPRSIVLRSGVRLVIEERAATETAAIRLIIRGGTLGEPEARRGTAALHARLLLRGTTTRTGLELARGAEDLGGRLSASAGLRSETLGLDVPAENCLQAIRLVAEILQHPRFDPDDLAKEKSLLLGSLAASRDDPSSDLEDEAIRLLFPKHPLSRLVRLDDAQVRAVTIDDVRALHERISGSLLVLIVVGRCNPPTVEATADDAFKNLALNGARPPPGRDQAARTRARVERFRRLHKKASALPGDERVERMPPHEPGVEETTNAAPRAGEQLPSTESNGGAPARESLLPPAPLSQDVRARVRKRTTQAEIMIALPTSGVSDEEAPAYSVLRFLLGGFQERLSSEVREKRGYAYWLSAEGLALPSAGWFGIHTGARKSHLAEIEKIVRSELSRIVSEPASAEEMERARRYLTTSEARLDTANGGRASILAGALLDERPLRTYEQRIARLEEVTPERVQQLARRLFGGQHLAVVTLH